MQKRSSKKDTDLIIDEQDLSDYEVAAEECCNDFVGIPLSP